MRPRSAGRTRPLRLTLALIAAASLLLAVPAEGGPGPGYLASDNVEYIGHVPLNYDSPGGRLHGGYFYVTNSRDLRIYDVSEPATPVLVGTLTMPQTPYFAQEDLDTNGSIALVGPYVVDVEDKTAPRIIGQHRAASHTITCIFDCTWAYTSSGFVVDVRDPSRPEVTGRWDDNLFFEQAAHDLTEVARGLVVTSSKPFYFLDARDDPHRPKLLAVAKTPPDTDIAHGNIWPRRGKERMLLFGTEAVGPSCNNESGELMVWDTRGWEKTRQFQLVTRYQMEGLGPVEGNNPVNLFCAHWFDTHPRYRRGGLVAMAWYEDGVRFLRVSAKGDVSETGYFIPLGDSTSAAYWITDRIVYVIGYHRGFEIIRFTGKLR